MQTERVTFLTSAEHKAALDSFAQRSGMSVGRVLREASAEFMAKPSAREEEQLAAIVAELAEALPDMKRRLERSARLLRDSAAEVDAMLREAGIRE